MNDIKSRYDKILNTGYDLCDKLGEFREEAWKIQEEACSQLTERIGRYFKVRDSALTGYYKGSSLRYFVLIAKPGVIDYGKPSHRMYQFSRTPAYCVFENKLPTQCFVDMSVFDPLSNRTFEDLYEEISEDAFLTAAKNATANVFHNHFPKKLGI